MQLFEVSLREWNILKFYLMAYHVNNEVKHGCTNTKHTVAQANEWHLILSA